MKLCPCGKKSIPGLIKSVALCQEHYNNLMFDTGDKHKEGVLMLRYSQQGKSIAPNDMKLVKAKECKQ